jgi:uncharacterized membrane protein YphA (DoxX/SURF4 family)
VAVTHGIQRGHEEMKQSIQKMGKAVKPVLVGTTILLFFGCIGLALPGFISKLGWLTRITAAILAVLMLVAIVFHIRCRKKPKIFASIILFALCAFVALGRLFWIY